MPAKTDLSFAFGLPPAKAKRFFESKGYTFSWRWEETLGAAHAKAFTVAKVVRMDVLQDIRGMVQKALDDGITFEQFRKELTPKLQEKGWWGEKFVAGPDGAIEKILEGSPRRLRTIYDMNLRTAYSAGREEHFQANIKARPYGMYVAVLDSKTRPKHRELHGKVYPLDDPFWQAFTPPIDWNCRCRKRALSARQVEQKGIKVLSSEGQLSKTDALVSTKTGELRQVTTITLPDGTKVSTGIGFDYNPATAAWQPDLDSYDADIALKYLEGAVTGPDFERFFDGKLRSNYPVGMVPEGVDLGAKSNVVTFSDDSLLKNKGLIPGRSPGHPEITLADYQKLPKLFSDAQLMVKQKDNTYQFFYQTDKLYYAVAKVTDSGEIFVQSYFQTRPRFARAQMRTGEVIKNDLF